MEHTKSHTPSEPTETLEKTKLQLIYDITGYSCRIENQEKFLEDALKLIADQFGADHACILSKQNSGRLETLAKLSRHEQLDNLLTSSNTLIEETMTSGTAILLRNAMDDQDFHQDPDFQRLNINSVICSPLKTNSSAFGVIYIASSNPNCWWDDKEMKLFDFIAHYIALALENLYLSEETEKIKRIAGNISRNMSHSVKNTLQIIGGAAETVDLALKTNQIDRVKRGWGILKSNLDKIQKFILDMLDYSKEEIEMENKSNRDSV